MNIPRLLIAIVVGFVFIFGTEFVIHTLLLDADYKASAPLWRPESEMMARFPWMIAGQFLGVATFVILWAIGPGQRGDMVKAFGFGLLMGLFSQANTIISYVVMPLPQALALKWFCAGLAEAIALALITAAIYKPAAYVGEPKVRTI
jgi:hypothetical protein